MFSKKCFISKYKIETLGDAKTLYQTVMELAGEHVNRPPIQLKGRRQAATHEQQMKRWQEHFAAVGPTELSRARCTARVRKRHRGHTDAGSEYGSNN